MPIPTPLRRYYRGKAWEAIQKKIRKRAKGRCEHCHSRTGTLFAKWLTIAHLDHDPRNRSLSNLRALCNACHNEHDGKQKAATRRHNKAQRIGQLYLSPEIEHAHRPEWYRELIAGSCQ